MIRIWIAIPCAPSASGQPGCWLCHLLPEAGQLGGLSAARHGATWLLQRLQGCEGRNAIVQPAFVHLYKPLKSVRGMQWKL